MTSLTISHTVKTQGLVSQTMVISVTIQDNYIYCTVEIYGNVSNYFSSGNIQVAYFSIVYGAVPIPMH